MNFLLTCATGTHTKTYFTIDPGTLYLFETSHRGNKNRKTNSC